MNGFPEDMSSLEILSPAGSPDALYAAVAGGADAVYFGAGAFNARVNARNFTKDEIFASIEYCHKRGVKCHATLNTLVSDRELVGEGSVMKDAELFASAGIDAFIVQDVGLARLLKRSCDIPLHGSTQMTIHSLEGVETLAEMGMSRAVLSRELSSDDIAYIQKKMPAGFELEIFGHGALCMCYSGQCYMSSVIGGRSGNRGACAQPCRMPYSGGYRLSLKDMCLLDHVEDIAALGVSSLKLEGRMKSPEYVYAVTKCYADVKRGIFVSTESRERLAEIFSRGGFTDGYYTGKIGKDMFGVKTETPEREIMKVPNTEYKRIPLDVRVSTLPDGNINVSFTEKNGIGAESTVCAETAKTSPTTPDGVKAALIKTGNTPCYVENITVDIPDGIFLSAASLNAARRECLEKMEAMRLCKNTYFKNICNPVSHTPCKEAPKLRGSFRNPSAIPENTELLDRIILPITSLNTREGVKAAAKYVDKLIYSLPPVFHDSEKGSIIEAVKTALDFGVKAFEVGNIGQIRLLKNISTEKNVPLEIHGAHGLNIFNSYSRDFYREAGLSSMLLTFEAPLALVRDIAEADCGLFAYGRLPFMITRNCIKEKHGKFEPLRDRTGKEFLLTCEYGCRNGIFNSDILWLADKREQLKGFGFLYLFFTDEGSERSAAVIKEYSEGSAASRLPDGYTRGNYIKGLKN